MTNPMHSAASREFGTPVHVVDFIRYVAGGDIGTDPFTNAAFNHFTVKARVFYDRENSGLDPRNPWTGFCLVNPPGGVTEIDPVTKKRKVIEPSLVKPAWNRLVDEWRHGRIDGGVWVGYSLEQLGLLQSEPTHPAMFACILTCERLDFLVRKPGGGPPRPQRSPTHSNYLTLLHSRRSPVEAKEQMRRFVERGASMGALVRPLV